MLIHNKNDKTRLKTRPLRQRGILTSVIAIPAVMSIAHASAQEQTKSKIKIEAQSLAPALTDLAEQIDKQIIVYTEDANANSVKGLEGEYTEQDALKLLLQDSKLKYVYLNERTIAVGSSKRLALNVDPKLSKPASSEKLAPNNVVTDKIGSNPVRVAQTDTQSPNRDVETMVPEKDGESDNEEGPDEIIATGSRIQGANATQRVLSITFDELKASGVTSVEDALRRVQSNFSSVNSDSADRAVDIEGLQLGAVPDGISGANLRGLGTENTLILVNGRRIAGVAGNFNGFGNIANIPLTAIERIEILPDGASAAYGSDAIGGVINVILRKDYQGFEISGRYENSSTDADGYKLNAVAGTGWDTGRLTVTGSYNQQDRIRSSKAGFRSLFYPGLVTDDAGNRQDLDFTRFQPDTGTLISQQFVFFPTFQVVTVETALPAGNNGVGVTAADFVDAATVSRVFDQELIPEFLGTDREQIGLTFDLSQELGTNVELFASGLWSQSKTFRSLPLAPARTFIGPDNPFNPFGTRQTVSYFPLQEFNSGILQAPTNRTQQDQLNLTLGFKWDINDDFNFEIAGGFSRSESDIEQRNLFDSSLAFDLNSVLFSSDPAVAINLIGDGTAQNPTAIQALYGRSVDSNPVTEVWTVEPVLKGDLFEAWGGDIKFAAGGEYREEKLSNSDLLQSFGRTMRNTTEVLGLFAEIDVPVVSSDNARPGIQSLSFSAQARYDEYNTSGPVGADIVDVSYDNISPRLGVAYSPVEGLFIRGSWGESFRAPTSGEVFGSTLSFNTDFLDPLAPGGAALIPGLTTVFASSNPDLQPETSTNTSVGIQYKPEFVENLTLDFDYSRVNFTNRIVNSSQLQLNLPAEIFVELPGVIERDAGGNATQLNLFNLNLDRRFVETIEGGAEYVHETTENGSFTFGVNAIYYLDLFDQIPGLEDRVENLGTSRGPVEYKITGHVGWKGENMGADVFVYHTPSNLNIQQVANTVTQSFDTLINNVSSYTTFDLTAYYEFPDYGLKVSAGARNLFDADFPVSPFSRLRSYDSSRVDPRGRVAFVELTKSF